MATNFIKSGKILTLIAPTGGVLSGALFNVGNIVAVAQTTAAEGEEVEGVKIGVFEVPKAAEAINQGDALFYDPEDKILTKTKATGLILVGAAEEDAGAGASTVIAYLDGAIRLPEA